MTEERLTPGLIRRRIKVNMDVLEELEFECQAPDRIEDQLKVVDKYLAAYRDHLALRKELMVEVQ